MLKFAFIGCGKVAKFHADAIRTLNGKIVGVSARPGSKNINGFSKIYRIPHVYDDWRKMVAIEEPEALVIAVSWDETEKIIQDIINTGIPCLVEKPVALSSHRLQEIMKYTESFHDRVMVGYNRRFYDFIFVIQQALEKKELISIELNFPEEVEKLSRRKSPKIAEHILFYMSSHWLDLLIFLLGDIKIVWMKKKVNQESGYVAAYNGILESLKYDVPIHLQANFNAPSNTSITFNFSDSIYRLCPIETLTVYKGMEVIGLNGEKKIKRYLPKVKNTFYTDAAYKPGFLKQMRYFIEVFVQKKKPNVIGCTLRDALRVTLLCEEIKNG